MAEKKLIDTVLLSKHGFIKEFKNNNYWLQNCISLYKSIDINSWTT